jgi:predicted deacylase
MEGLSGENGHEAMVMPLWRADSGKPGPVILITAGVHGDEFEPILALYRLSARLPQVLTCGSVITMPVVNGGAVRSGTRCGPDGQDLARICPGDPLGTPAERDANAVSRLIRSSDYLIDLHTGGRILDIHPMAGYMIHPDPSILARQREMARAFGLPLIWGTDPAPNGRTLSVARDAGIPSMYVEYGGGSVVRPHIEEAYVEGCLRVLALLGLVSPETTKPAASVTCWVEDARPNQGHLQSKMPSPADGIFVAAVVLGQEVVRGDLWGYVFDPFRGDRREVFAEDDGLVLFLRAEAIVRAGDSLGGICVIDERVKHLMA